MKVIIHDLTDRQFQQVFPQITGNTQITGDAQITEDMKITGDAQIISDKGCIKSCIGCFGCWVKTPGQCVIKDGYETMGHILSQADTVIIISECCYGGYSPFVKNVLDRSISFLLPFFKTMNHETHHKPRYRQSFRLSVYFYGKHITQTEKETAQKMVARNSINFHVSKHTVTFFRSIEQLCENRGEPKK